MSGELIFSSLSEQPTRLARVLPTCNVQGKRMNLGRLIGVLFLNVLFIAFAYYSFSKEGGLVLPGVLVFVGFLTFLTLANWRRPPRIEVADTFYWRFPGGKISTPRDNVEQLLLQARQVLIKFRDVALVEPASLRPGWNKNGAKTGYHLALQSDIFDLDQVNQVRASLGLERQERDERGELLSEHEAMLRRCTPQLWVTPSIVVLNVVLFALLLCLSLQQKEALPQAGLGSIPGELMLRWGGNYGPLTANGEPLRLLTSVFLHWSVMHLFFNMWVLWGIGRLLEQLLGNGRYLVVYLFCGICGSLASVVWNQSVVSAGASGAVFGMFGVLLGLVLRGRKEMPVEALQKHRSECISFLVFNLLLSAGVSGIDMAAHVGGLLGGLACGLLLVPVSMTATGEVRRPRMAVLTLTCVALIAVFVALLPKPTADLKREVALVFQQESRLANAFLSISQEIEKNNLKHDEIVDRVRREVIAPWNKSRLLLAGLENVAPQDQTSVTALVEFMRLREESWLLLAEGVAEQNGAKQGRGIEKADAARDVLAAWLKQDGRRFAPTLAVKEMPTDLSVEMVRVAAFEERAMKKHSEAAQQWEQKKLTDDQFADLIDREILPPWRAGLIRFQQFIGRGAVTMPEQAAYAAKMQKYLKLREQGWQLLSESLHESNTDKRTQAEAKWVEAEQYLPREAISQ